MSFIKHNDLNETEKYEYDLIVLVKYDGGRTLDFESEPQDHPFTLDEINTLLTEWVDNKLNEKYIRVNHNDYLIYDDGYMMIIINEMVR